MSTLNIYKASAGSGKTFRLTLEYIKLLLQNEYSYRNVLAVTFTNKATSEMKQRVLSVLDSLANKPEKSGYSSIIAQETGLSNTDIQANAEKALRRLLHEFSFFNISTIDSFFQKVLRAFGRELGLHSSFELELNNNDIKDEAIDRMLNKLDSNKQVKKWLSTYGKDKIDKEKTWNIREDLSRLTEILFKDNFKVFKDNDKNKIFDKDFIDEYAKDLKLVISTFEDDIIAKCNNLISLVRANGLEPFDFKYGNKGAFSTIMKFRDKNFSDVGKRAINACSNPESLLPAKNNTEKYNSACNIISDVSTTFCDILSYFDDNIAQYNSASDIYAHIYLIGLLSDINSEIKEICIENNVFLISDTAMILREIINEDETPFIYEKLGSHLKHFMIDEFQDTSQLQWDNFLPLLKNGLSEGHNSLIVGDTKQSIYRWRNGDWKLLEYHASDDIHPFNLDVYHLNKNWRSKQNIVNFNNHMYSSLRELVRTEVSELVGDISQQVLDAYSDYQQISSSTDYTNKGFISIDLVDTSNKPDNYKAKDWETEVSLELLLKHIFSLQDRGQKASDIAILTRTNKEATIIAEFLIGKQAEHKTYNLDFTSMDGLTLSKSVAIKFIISFLRHLNSPSDDTHKALLTYLYYSHLNKDKTLKDEDIFENFNSLFNDIVDSYDDTPSISLLETMEFVSSRFRLNDISGSKDFLAQLFDEVIKFQRRINNSLPAFIEWWDNKGHSINISIPDTHDAIKILTIHKSKGLEFKSVILPFTSWSIISNRSREEIIWCRSEEAPYNRLNQNPQHFGSYKRPGIFNSTLYQELTDRYIENLNILYVASTRAEDNLFIISTDINTPSIDKTNNSTALWIKNMCKTIPLTTQQETKDKHTNISIGKIAQYPCNKDNKDNSLEIENNYFSHYTEKLRIHEQSKLYFVDQKQGGKREMGNIMHKILESVITAKDIPRSVEIAVLEGFIEKEIQTELTETLVNFVSRAEYKEYFERGANVLTEREVLCGNKGIQRPDRIVIKDNKCTVIDFKFGKPEAKHKKQIKYYKQILSEALGLPTEGLIMYF
ncbi:MAG: UvrD-helicase domain-containing protein [Bacteroidales bacterium]